MVRFEESRGESDVDDIPLAPVTPLFGGSVSPPTAAPRARAWDADDRFAAGSGADEDDPFPEPQQAEAGDRVGDAEDAERALLKRLRTRSLSVREAEAVLQRFEIDGESRVHIIARMIDFGYLDDAALAEQLVHAGADRKRQGRQAIAQTLVKRGVPREVADAALADMPDDDADRALEFARSKARSMASLDRDAALRRLAGQLSRRGYGGSVALEAARRALDEGTGPQTSVRFR